MAKRKGTIVAKFENNASVGVGLRGERDVVFFWHFVFSPVTAILNL